MSRSDRARKEKQAAKRKLRIVLFTGGMLILAALGIYLFTVFLPGLFDSSLESCIDEERSQARIDFFGLTYVQVFLIDGCTVDSAWVGDEPLDYNPFEGRWEKVLGGHSEGDLLIVTVHKGEEVAGKFALTITGIPLDD